MPEIIENWTGGVELRGWTEGVYVEDAAKQQLRNISVLPFIAGHIAVMPDVHLGNGATVGSVIPARGAIIPAAVGVDIGCGMQAVRTSLTASQLPDSLTDLRTRIEHAVPHGGLGPASGWGGKGMPNSVIRKWVDSGLEKRFDALCKKHPKLKDGNALVHLGSLGGGNHFIEVCIDTEQRVWVMLHSGSRGIGNLIGRIFIDRAKEMMLKRDCRKPADKELAWFEENEPEFHDYVEAVSWAQDFARCNRDVMMMRVLTAMRESGLPSFTIDKEAINSHHNFVEKEYHFGQWVYLTRKGAVSAKEGELGIIPGSMGAKSFIVRGKGNADSYCSCSHGAGRMMSRTEAKRRFTVEDQIAATAGVECRKDAGVIDEIPLAYKDIDAVMAAQADLVDIVATLKQVLCVKG